jgi:tetratricopeptide (TPR) repeat protein
MEASKSKQLRATVQPLSFASRWTRRSAALLAVVGFVGCDSPQTAPDPSPAPAPPTPTQPAPDLATPSEPAAPSATPDAGPAAQPARLMEFEPSSGEQEVLLQTGKKALASGDDARAQQAFEQLAHGGPISGARASGAIALADIYTDQGKLDEAVTLLASLQKIAPPHPELAYVLGRAQKAGGKREAAIFSYREALRLQPLLLQAHIEIGGMYGELGEAELAAKSFLAYETAVYRYAKILEDSQAHPTDKLKICDAFSFLPDDRAAQALLGALGDEHRDVQFAAAEALGEVGTKPMIPRLLELSKAASDSDPRLAKSLADSAARIGANADDADDRIGPKTLTAPPGADAGPPDAPQPDAGGGK